MEGWRPGAAWERNLDVLMACQDGQGNYWDAKEQFNNTYNRSTNFHCPIYCHLRHALKFQHRCTKVPMSLLSLTANLVYYFFHEESKLYEVNGHFHDSCFTASDT